MLPVADEDILANIGPVTQVSQPLTQHQKLELVLPTITISIKTPRHVPLRRNKTPRQVPKHRAPYHTE